VSDGKVSTPGRKDKTRRVIEKRAAHYENGSLRRGSLPSLKKEKEKTLKKKGFGT